MSCVVLGVTGGIAAYKSAEIASQLKKQGHDVYVIMTKHATEFIAPLTFETLTNHPVVVDMFTRETPWEVEHIALAKRADVFFGRACQRQFFREICKWHCGRYADHYGVGNQSTRCLGAGDEYQYVEQCNRPEKRGSAQVFRRFHGRPG